MSWNFSLTITCNPNKKEWNLNQPDLLENPVWVNYISGSSGQNRNNFLSYACLFIINSLLAIHTKKLAPRHLPSMPLYCTATVK